MQAAFRHRPEAGRVLARRLRRFAGQDVLVYALPRGGVPVAYEVAQALGADLDVIVVRKLGLPGQPELAIGAIASGGVVILNRELLQYMELPVTAIDRIAQLELAELKRRERLYRKDASPPHVAGRTAILVDDGLATGSTMRAAARAVRQQGASRVIVAVPIASTEGCRELADEVDEMVCAMTPQPFFAVGAWYEDFSQTTDDEVVRLLEEARRSRSCTAWAHDRERRKGEGRPGCRPV